MHQNRVSQSLQLLSQQSEQFAHPTPAPSSLALKQPVEFNLLRLQSEHLEPLTKYAKLYSLDLNLNKISDFSWTRFLKRLRISEISLKGNPISLEPEYREKTFKALGVDLETLDGLDRMGNAADDLSISESDEVVMN